MIGSRLEGVLSEECRIGGVGWVGGIGGIGGGGYMVVKNLVEFRTRYMPKIAFLGMRIGGYLGLMERASMYSSLSHG